MSSIIVISVFNFAFQELLEYEKRLKTFKGIPKKMYVRKHCKELARSGWFYTGKKDQTIFFNCGGGLRIWEPTDDVRIE